MAFAYSNPTFPWVALPTGGEFLTCTFADPLIPLIFVILIVLINSITRSWKRIVQVLTTNFMGQAYNPSLLSRPDSHTTHIKLSIYVIRRSNLAYLLHVLSLVALSARFGSTLCDVTAMLTAPPQLVLQLVSPRNCRMAMSRFSSPTGG
jgi:hypothetical protein